MQVSNVKLGIGVPNNFPYVPSAFLDSFILMEKPPFIYLRSSSTHDLAELRNKIVQEALKHGCTHLLMMDSDQIYQKDTISRLMEHHKKIVGCLVNRRYPPFDPLLLMGDIGHYQLKKDWREGEMVTVDATGTGCLLFETQLFREMDKAAQEKIDKWNAVKPSNDEIAYLPENVQAYIRGLEERYEPEHVPGRYFQFRKDKNGRPIGEDIGFCSDIRKLGYDIYVDTSCTAGHISTVLVTMDTYRLFSCLDEAKAKYEAEHGVGTVRAA